MQSAPTRTDAGERRTASDGSAGGGTDGSTAGGTDGPTVADRAWDVTTGAVAGTVATVVMSAFRMPVSRSLPPTAWFWSEYVEEERPRENLVGVFGLHLLYGVGAGAAFGALFGRYLEGRDVTQERRGTLLGVVYGGLLSVFGTKVVLERLLGMDLKPDERFVFHVGHVIFGLTLGTLFGSYE